MAAMRHFFEQGSQPVPDTGSLRGDVIALLTEANESRYTMAAVISVQLGAYFQETETTPADLRGQLLGDRPPAIEAIMSRAVERGEVTAAALTPRLVNLPFDLIRHEALMTLAPIPPETIVEIVDDIFLPLVSRRSHDDNADRRPAISAG